MIEFTRMTLIINEELKIFGYNTKSQNLFEFFFLQNTVNDVGVHLWWQAIDGTQAGHLKFAVTRWVR